MGKLYIVPTPIGNLKDMTLRGLEVLKEADFVAAEDTRQTLKLLNHFGIKKSLISYHQHNENGKSQDLIDLLEQGKNIALVSDAGTPGISDPGCVVIRECIKKNLDFEVLPGATAITTAVVNSGLDTTGFTFKGFLPRENKDRTAVIEKLKNSQETLIFFRDGVIKEATIAAGDDYNLEFGDIIGEADDFSFDLDEHTNMLKLKIVMDGKAKAIETYIGAYR